MDHVLTCILNDKAGCNNAAEARALIGRVASERGWEARILLSSTGSDLSRLAEQARAAGGLIVSGGGDGTIAAVAAALVGEDAVFGVLPMGTLNHFAKDLGIPLELEKGKHFTGKVALVDVGEVNGRIFLNNSSIGFYPRVVKERERQQRQGRRKWLALAMPARSCSSSPARCMSNWTEIALISHMTRLSCSSATTVTPLRASISARGLP